MAKNDTKEWQFDGLVGPTHNYAGLSVGNLASEKNAGLVSNPRAAALQGLEKMRFVRDLGVPQAFFPPQKRQVVSILEQMGFGEGKIALHNAYKHAPWILASCFSSSYMWAANAATVSPSADTSDGKVHFTPANLISNFHRSLEAETTYRTLKTIFHNESLFKVHNFLPKTAIMSDEGAANHMRVCTNHGNSGLEIFVFGAQFLAKKIVKEFPARQHLEACRTIFRRHGLSDERIIYVQQSPNVIDQGVFHNDVIAMNTAGLMIAHEEAFVDQSAFIYQLERSGVEGFRFVEVGSSELSVPEAVSSYLFNSQLIQMPNNQYILIAPIECEEQLASKKVIQRLVEGKGVVSTVHYLNVRESMRNGGGPACLRLRVALTEVESAAMHPGILLTDSRYAALTQWVKQFYRDKLTLKDLSDPQLLDELEAAYTALESIVDLPGFYSHPW